MSDISWLEATHLFDKISQYLSKVELQRNSQNFMDLKKSPPVSVFSETEVIVFAKRPRTS